MAAIIGLLVAVAASLVSLATREPARPQDIASIPYDGRSPVVPATGNEQRVLVRLPRPSLGAAMATSPALADAAVQQRYTASLEAEGASLRSALEARGVTLRDVVTFSRAWNGFAATVPVDDLPALQSLGVRELPIRRFYPSSNGAEKLADALPELPEPQPGAEPIALLDSGVDDRSPLLRGRVEPGYDAVDRDRSTRPGRDPRQPARQDQHGTQLAGILALAGEKIQPFRIAGLQLDPRTGIASEFGTTDQLLAGIERVVDPDNDGDAADALPVALVGVNAPYAGFEDSPEAEAVEGAAGLGTLIIGPAGNEGQAQGVYGTVGGPGAGPSTLTVGALEGDGLPGLPKVFLQATSGMALPAAELLGGRPPTRPLESSGPLSGTRRSLVDRNGVSRVTGRLAIVEPGDRPAARVTEVAAAGPAAILLVDPDPSAPLPAIADAPGGIPVLGLTGPAARLAKLQLPRDARVVFSPATIGAAGGRVEASPYSARGPALEGAVKPDLAAGGAAVTAALGGTPIVMSGTSVAAANAAIEASRLTRQRPQLSADDRAAMLTAAAAPSLDVRGTGAGILRTPPPDGLLTEPRSLSVSAPGRARWEVARELTVRNPGTRPRTLDLAVTATPAASARTLPRRVVVPPGGEVPVQVIIEGRGVPPAARAGHAAAENQRAAARNRFRARTVTGRLVGSERGQPVLSVPLAVSVGRPAPPPVGRIRLTRTKGKVDGVRFQAGAFDRGNPATTGTRVEPIGRLVLELRRENGETVRTLTPQGGAIGLLPAVFGYTLPDSALKELGKGRYRFVVQVTGPRGGPARTAGSPLFTR